jgi:hypothetical protein
MFRDRCTTSDEPGHWQDLLPQAGELRLHIDREGASDRAVGGRFKDNNFSGALPGTQK